MGFLSGFVVIAKTRGLGGCSKPPMCFTAEAAAGRGWVSWSANRGGGQWAEDASSG